MNARFYLVLFAVVMCIERRDVRTKQLTIRQVYFLGDAPVPPSEKCDAEEMSAVDSASALLKFVEETSTGTGRLCSPRNSN
jgi:hypothetical protein